MSLEKVDEDEARSHLQFPRTRRLSNLGMILCGAIHGYARSIARFRLLLTRHPPLTAAIVALVLCTELSFSIQCSQTKGVRVAGVLVLTF